ncbi:MAG: ankyrin repeat domain-containing protein [Candidatus Babeliaceae bacterium]|jgi:ankyrin repeat protein
MHYSLSKNLINAVKSQAVDSVRNFLIQGADPNCCDVQGIPALHHAVYRGNHVIAKLLHDHGALVHVTASQKRTALHWLAHSGGFLDHVEAYEKYKKTLSFLVDAHINLQAVDEFGKTALHLAAEYNNAWVTRELVQYSINVNCVDDKKYTPLHYAANGGWAHIVKILLDHGSDPEMLSLDGSTALQIADFCWYDEVAQLLKDSKTLQYQLAMPQPTLLRTLIRFLYCTHNGDSVKTALVVARQFNHVEDLSILEKNDEHAQNYSRAYLKGYLKKE